MTRQRVFDFPHRPAFGADDFLVAESNAAAVAAIDRWPDWPAPTLVLAGPAGSGKTHLAHVLRARSGAVMPDSATLAVDRLPEQIGAAVEVIVDDAERAPEQALLHLVNLVAERRGHLLLTAARSPARWGTALPDLRSRLVAAPLAELAAPDDALLGAVLVKLFADRQLAVGDGVVAFLLQHMERSLGAARDVVAALDRAALAERRALTVPLARAVLGSEEGG